MKMLRGAQERCRFLALVVITVIIVAFDFIFMRAITMPTDHLPRYDLSTEFNYTLRRPTCTEKHHVVFLKTHKTGSTTASAIFQRFGNKRNLTFLVPDHRHILDEGDLFDTRRIGKPLSNKWNFSVGYQMLTNHVRYNRSEMDKVFHNSAYVTTLRNPVAQFESGFYYFEMERFLPKSEDPIELFMSDPVKYYNFVQQKYPGKETRLHNMQLFDLGMDSVDMYRQDIIEEKIKQLDEEFDLVMITEYFDESLVLLRKLLCWSIKDITYTSRGIRAPSHRKKMTDELRSKVLHWNSGDARLYDHFNRTFWEKVRMYEGDFEKDLAMFRQYQEFVEKCLSEGQEGGEKDQRTVVFNLVKDAPTWCHEYKISDITSSEQARDRMRVLGIPQYQSKRSQKKVMSVKPAVKKVRTKKVSLSKEPKSVQNALVDMHELRQSPALGDEKKSKSFTPVGNQTRDGNSKAFPVTNVNQDRERKISENLVSKKIDLLEKVETNSKDEKILSAKKFEQAKSPQGSSSPKKKVVKRVIKRKVPKKE